MPLLKLEDFDSNYREILGGNDIKGWGVYSESDQKIGTVSDILVDEDGRFRYFVVDLGFWIFGKKVLLPMGRSRIDYNADRIYAIGMTKDQAENLPEYNEQMTADYDYEERVRRVYRTPSVEASAPVNTAAPVDYNRANYSYDREPNLYALNDREHQTLRLYEERLIANKNRQKTGEVTVGKHVETETARVAVPVEKERVVIERTTPDNMRPVDPNNVDFREGEVARMEVYEETPNIHKEAFVREEVTVRKEVDRDTVTAEDTVRREELDIDTEGRPNFDKRL